MNNSIEHEFSHLIDFEHVDPASSIQAYTYQILRRGGQPLAEPAEILKLPEWQQRFESQTLQGYHNGVSGGQQLHQVLQGHDMAQHATGLRFDSEFEILSQTCGAASRPMQDELNKEQLGVERREVEGRSYDPSQEMDSLPCFDHEYSLQEDGRKIASSERFIFTHDAIHFQSYENNLSNDNISPLFVPDSNVSDNQDTGYGCYFKIPGLPINQAPLSVDATTLMESPMMWPEKANELMIVSVESFPRLRDMDKDLASRQLLDENSNQFIKGASLISPEEGIRLLQEAQEDCTSSHIPLAPKTLGKFSRRYKVPGVTIINNATYN